MNAATLLPRGPEPPDLHDRAMSLGVVLAVLALLLVLGAVRAFPDNESWPTCAEQGLEGVYMYRWRVDSASTPVTRCSRPDAGLRVSFTPFPGAGARGAAGAHYPSPRGSSPRPATTSRAR